MSDRPTPETDALERCQDIQRLQPARDFRFWHGDRLEQMRNLARKLERERDEAREQAIHAAEIGLKCARECLHWRDEHFHRVSRAGTTSHLVYNLDSAKRDIGEIERALQLLRKEGGAR